MNGKYRTWLAVWFAIGIALVLLQQFHILALNLPFPLIGTIFLMVVVAFLARRFRRSNGGEKYGLSASTRRRAKIGGWIGIGLMALAFAWAYAALRFFVEASPIEPLWWFLPSLLFLAAGAWLISAQVFAWMMGAPSA